MNKLMILLVLQAFLAGCSTLGYYIDAINGHHEVLDKQQPVSLLLKSNKLAPELRQRLQQTQLARDFASSELLLPDNDSYRNYSDLGRDYVVWNVIASKEFSVEARQWCFLFAGCLSYRGYYSKQAAEDYAEELQQQGYDVYVAGARAYSTLGWFDDPLLNTMMMKSEISTIGIIFHELAHQKLYVDDDSEFNEAFAVFVEEEGIRRWLIKQNKNEQFKAYILGKKRRQQFNAMLKTTRSKLRSLYERNITTQQKRVAKQQIFASLQQDYLELKKSWKGYKGYDKWMKQPLNNAHLALVATYNDLVPAFRAAFCQHGGKLESFYEFAQSLATLEQPQRHSRLTDPAMATKKNCRGL